MKNILLLILFIALGWGGYYVYENRHDVFSSTGRVETLSISSDGKYVISAHSGRITKLVLWDLEKREKKVLAEKVNTNTAYFIPNSYDFMWQGSKDKVVHIQNVEGKELASFKHFEVARHIMSADRTFYASANQTGKIFKGYGENMVPIYTDIPIWNHYNFDLSDKYFLTASNGSTPENAGAVQLNPTADPVQPSVYKKSSYDGVTLWDRETLKPVARLWGFGGRSDALFSPDGKWIVAGGENRRDYMWEVNNLQNRLELANAENGVLDIHTQTYDKSKLLPVPDKLKEKQLHSMSSTVTYAFLTETDFIQIKLAASEDGNGQEIVSLYQAGDPWIKGYVEIGNNPTISTDFFELSNSVASAPKAHILVTGQAAHGGINVYRYHPDKMELEKIWVAY